MLYIVLGRSSIFVFNGLLAFIGPGCIIVYLTLATRIIRQFVSDMGYKEGLIQEKYPWVILISIVLLPIFLRRSLVEMRL
jgi:amino acid permease